MKCNWKVGYLLIGGLVFGATPAMALPTFTGPWVVDYWQDDARGSAGTQCLNFTVDAAGVFGSRGGAFSSPSVSGWVGNWVQQGDRVRWWGRIGNNYATSSEGTLINPNIMTGHYLHYPLPGSGFGPSIGTWSARPGTTGTAPC